MVMGTGLCHRCGERPITGTRLCDACGGYSRRYSAQRRARLRAARRCETCEVKLPRNYYGTRCADCAADHRAVHRRRSQVFADAGLCVQCGGEKHTDSGRRCRRCQKYMVDYYRRRRAAFIGPRRPGGRPRKRQEGH